jgi:hypothetical protein
MYTTRFISPKEPAINPRPTPEGRVVHPDCAVLLLAHGSSRRIEAAASLQRQAEALRARGIFGEVAAACLVGESACPLAALARLTKPTVVIVPMMMCAGWTTDWAVPQCRRLAADDAKEPGRQVLVCDPLGLEPGIADLIADRVTDHATRAGWLSTAVTVLLVAHGSQRHIASEAATETQAARLRDQRRFRAVATAYLQQPPRLGDVLPSLKRPVVVVGFLAAPGHHAAIDIAQVVDGERDHGVVDLGPIGAHAAVPDLVQDMVEARLRDACRRLSTG